MEKEGLLTTSKYYYAPPTNFVPGFVATVDVLAGVFVRSPHH